MFHFITRPKKIVTVYTTAENTNLQLTKAESKLTFSELKQPLETQSCVFVNSNIRFQTFLGIGGAITDASAEVFAKLSQNKQQKIMDAYFSKDKGIGYTIIRTNIHSCDFSSGSYTYIVEGGKDLKTFDINTGMNNENLT